MGGTDYTRVLCPLAFEGSCIGMQQEAQLGHRAGLGADSWFSALSSLALADTARTLGGCASSENSVQAFAIISLSNPPQNTLSE